MPTRPLKSIRLLIIDDDAQQQDIITRAAQKILPNVETTVVGSSQETLAWLKRREDAGTGWPHLILLDLYLPQREAGLALLQTMKSAFKIPVLVMSVSSLPEDIADAYDRGANSYLVKPMTNSEWLERFQNIKEYWFEHVALPSQNGWRDSI